MKRKTSLPNCKTNKEKPLITKIRGLFHDDKAKIEFWYKLIWKIDFKLYPNEYWDKLNWETDFNLYPNPYWNKLIRKTDFKLYPNQD